MLLIGCKKHNDESSSFLSSFQGVINNVPISFAETNSHHAGWAVTSSQILNNPDSTYFDFEASLWQYYKSDSIYQNSIFIAFIYHIPNDSLYFTNTHPCFYEHTFRQLFRIGDFEYTYESFSKSGIIVTWYDDKGLQWVSGKIQGENNGFPPTHPDYSHNNFKIVYSKPVVPVYGFTTWGQEVHMTFGCWVYNYYGDSLHIENAKFNVNYYYKNL